MSKELKTILIIAGAVLFIGFGAFLWYKQNSALDHSQPVDGSKLLRTDSQILGKADAPNTLVEFGDYQCPACGAAHPILKEMVNGANKDKIRIVFRNFPLSQHKNAYPSAQAAEAAAKQGKFAEMHDKLYETQNSWSAEADPKSTFIQYAKDLGLDVKKFESDYDDPILKERIKIDTKDGNDLGVNSTPTFYLNGEKFEGWNFSNLKSELEKKLK